MYAAGSSGNGSAPAALLTTAATTDATGLAEITLPTCSAGGSLLYLVSTGGTVSGQTTASPQAELMTELGTCTGLSASTSVTVNEATTVAGIYALAPFYTAGAGIGASATNTAGLANAFAVGMALADAGSGAVPGAALPGNVTIPTARVNSLANLVNACVVSAANCFYTTVALPGSPTNTLDGLWGVAAAPTANTAALYAETRASTAYAPALAEAPADFSLYETISGGGLNQPTGLGVDASGAVWVASYASVASKFLPTGAVAIAGGVTGGGLEESYGLAVDGSENVWIPNQQSTSGTFNGTVSEFSSSGMSLAGTGGYASGGLFFPTSVAIDPNGTVWVANYGNSITLLNSSGQPLSGADGYVANSFDFPDVVAIDGNHFGWVGNQQDGNVTKVAADGSSLTVYSCCNGADGIAMDEGDNVWIANYRSGSVSMISSGGQVISNQGYTALGSLDVPQGIAVDGSGNVWVANYGAPRLAELAGSTSTSPGASLTPAAGLGGDAELSQAYALAVDASGSVWVSNHGNSTVTRFVGLATPVKTPLLGLPQLP